MEKFLLLTVVGFVTGIGLFWIRLRLDEGGNWKTAFKPAALGIVFTVRGWRNVIAALTTTCFIAWCLSPGKPLSWFSDAPYNPYPSIWDDLGEWPWLTLFFSYLVLTIVLAFVSRRNAVQKA